MGEHLSHRKGQAEVEAENLRGSLAWLSRHRWFMVLGSVAFGAAAYMWSLHQQPTFEASCRIEFDPDPPQPLGQEIELVYQSSMGFWAGQQWIQTQLEVLSSREIAERVVRKFGLNENADFLRVVEKDLEPTSVEDAAMELQSRVSVSALEGTALATLRVRDHDPERAALLANAMAEAYLASTLEYSMAATVRALDWLRSQLVKVKAQLGSAEQTMQDFKEQRNVLSLDLKDRQNIVANQIESYTLALTRTRAERIALAARLFELQKVSRDSPLLFHSPDVFQNEQIIQLRHGLRDALREKAILAERYGEQHSVYRAVTRRVEQLEIALRQDLDGLLAAARAEVEQAKATERGLLAELREVNRAGLELNLMEIEYGRLARDKETSAQLYKILLDRTAETDLTSVQPSASARVVDKALAPLKSVRPLVRTNTALGAVAGLLISFLTVAGFSVLDRKLRSPRDLESLGVGLIGVFPRLGQRGFGKVRPPVGAADLIVHKEPLSPAAECCRGIRTHLAFRRVGGSRGPIVVTSANPLDGKTTFTLNLAAALAQSKKTVIVVGADLRRPRLGTALGAPSGAPGITSVLLGEAELSDAVWKTDVPGMHLLPAGPVPPNPVELLDSEAFKALIRELASTYDEVIIDTPPVNAVTDVAVIAPLAVGVVFVARAGHTTRDSLSAALHKLRDVGVDVWGCVLNGVGSAGGGYSEGYYFADAYYGSYAEREA